MALIECPECGGKVSDKATICIHCGYPLHENSCEGKNEIKYCPYCGEVNNIENIFCCNCGRSFVRENEEKVDMGITNGSVDIMDYKNDLDMLDGITQLQASQSKMQFSAQAKCPKCNSISLAGEKQGFNFGKAAVGVALIGGAGLLMGGMGANKTVVTCLNCGYKFKL